MSQLHRRAARADRPGFLHLYRAHGAFVRAALRFQGIAREDLEDVQQDVFLAIHRGLPRFKPRLDARGGAPGGPLRARRMILARRAGWDPVKAWIYGIVWRVAGHYHERSHRRHEAPSEAEVARALELADRAQQGGRADEALAREQRDEVLAEVLAEVERERRLILVLHDLLEVPVPRIAEALRVPVSTAQTRLRLAREDLAAAIRRLDRERREALRPGRPLLVLGLAGRSAVEAAGAAREGVAAAWRWLGERVRRGLARAAGAVVRAGGRAGAGAATAARGAITVGVGAVLLGAAASHGCAATRAVETRPARGETAGAVVQAAGLTRGARASGVFAPAMQPAVSAAVVAPPRPFGDEAPAAGLPAIPRGRQGSAGAGGSATTQGSADAQGPDAGGDDERALLGEALAAFHRGDLDRALERLVAHATRYPRGRFAGSRERLRGRVLTRIAHPTGQPQSLPSPTLRGDRTEHQLKGHYE